MFAAWGYYLEESCPRLVSRPAKSPEFPCPTPSTRSPRRLSPTPGPVPRCLGRWRRARCGSSLRGCTPGTVRTLRKRWCGGTSGRSWPVTSRERWSRIARRWRTFPRPTGRSAWSLPAAGTSVCRESRFGPGGASGPCCRIGRSSGGCSCRQEVAPSSRTCGRPARGQASCGALSAAGRSRNVWMP